MLLVFTSASSRPNASLTRKFLFIGTTGYLVTLVARTNSSHYMRPGNLDSTLVFIKRQYKNSTFRRSHDNSCPRGLPKLREIAVAENTTHHCQYNVTNYLAPPSREYKATTTTLRQPTHFGKILQAKKNKIH